MAIKDEFLEDVAKAVVGSDYAPITRIGFAETDTPTSNAQLVDELGDRKTVSRFNTNNQIELEAARFGTDVVDQTNGDIIEAIGYLQSDDSGDVLRITIDLDSLQHTRDFDLSFRTVVTVNK